MHLIFSINKHFNAGASARFPPYAKDKHTLKQKTHLANGAESWKKKRIPHLACAGTSLGHLCVYVAMGGYVKLKRDYDSVFSPLSLCNVIPVPAAPRKPAFFTFRIVPERPV